VPNIDVPSSCSSQPIFTLLITCTAADHGSLGPRHECADYASLTNHSTCRLPSTDAYRICTPNPRAIRDAFGSTTLTTYDFNDLVQCKEAISTARGISTVAHVKQRGIAHWSGVATWIEQISDSCHLRKPRQALLLGSKTSQRSRGGELDRTVKLLTSD
jgi:hypothetical protein